MSKTSFQIKHVTKDRGNKCGKVEDYKCKKWVWWEKPEGSDGHGGGSWGLLRMGMDIHAYGKHAWAWAYEVGLIRAGNSYA